MMLEISNLKFSYKNKEIFNQIDFNLESNEILSILGPNGVGKTTLLKCINRILRPQGGSILVENQDIMNIKRIEIAKKLGYVPQRNETVRITVFDAILLGRKPHIKWDVSNKDISLVNSAMKKLNMEDLSLRYLDELSGGELQKVGIARAIVQEPKILLLDEPTSSLDLKNQQEILYLLSEIVDGHDVSVIMTMHDINSALRFSDKFIFLKGG
ncbi:MAG TPA: ABC transporter ATP-binding protein, partial [Methanofastidiosum sp.]|nr:ABC transporter ATP-binding protein [Methanofastidiosum sp.]